MDCIFAIKTIILIAIFVWLFYEINIRTKIFNVETREDKIIDIEMNKRTRKRLMKMREANRRQEKRDRENKLMRGIWGVLCEKTEKIPRATSVHIKNAGEKTTTG